MPWISVRNWRTFQHYDPAKRVPPWIKNNTDLMANDAYLSLTVHRALMLHRLWLEYATSRCELSDDTLRLSRRLGMKVTSLDLASLNHAGFINIVASRALAEGYHGASARTRATETETEEEKEELIPKAVAVDVDATRNNNAAEQHYDYSQKEHQLPDLTTVLNDMPA